MKIMNEICLVLMLVSLINVLQCYSLDDELPVTSMYSNVYEMPALSYKEKYCNVTGNEFKSPSRVCEICTEIGNLDRIAQEMCDKIINFNNNKVLFRHFKTKLYKKYMEKCHPNVNMFYGVISFGFVSLQEWWTESTDANEQCVQILN